MRRARNVFAKLGCSRKWKWNNASYELFDVNPILQMRVLPKRKNRWLRKSLRLDPPKIQNELEAAKIALAQLTEAAQIAAAKRERAELDFAEANLRRQQKLLRLGSAQKSDVTRAEQKLAELKAQKELIR